MPFSSSDHGNLSTLWKHLPAFTDITSVARGKGLGENPDISVARLRSSKYYRDPL